LTKNKDKIKNFLREGVTKSTREKHRNVDGKTHKNRNFDRREVRRLCERGMGHGLPSGVAPSKLCQILKNYQI
jgi:hypothetical protein